MKKTIAAVLLVGLSAAAGASGMEQFRAAGFAPITLEQIKARSVPANKGVTIIINNTSTNNGSSSVNTSVSVNGADIGAPGPNGVSVAVNNNSAHNNTSSVGTNVSVNNTGVNSPGDDTIAVNVNNNSAHNGVSGVDTNVNVNNTNDGAYSDGNIGVNIGNNDNGNGSAVSGTDVTVNGVNSGAGKEEVYQSLVFYRHEIQAERAMGTVLNNLDKAKNVRVLSRKVKRCGYYFVFEVRFRSKLPMRTFTQQKLFSSAVQAENLMYNTVLDLRSRNARIINAELIETGTGYTYVIAYFQE